MAPYIQVRDLKKVYNLGDRRVEALRGINLDIERAGFIVFVGHSGSGKTTLVSIIGGLTRPTEGSVLAEGVDIWSLSDRDLSGFRNRTIGFVFQSFSLLPTLDVLNNVVMPVIFRRNGTPDHHALKARALSILSDLEMSHKADAYPSELSGGEQRRVAIARALVNDPEILLADEPTGELDIRTEREVIDIFRNINREYNKTVIVVSHSLSWIDKADTVVVMKEGLTRTNVDDPVRALMGETCSL